MGFPDQQKSWPVPLSFYLIICIFCAIYDAGKIILSQIMGKTAVPLGGTAFSSQSSLQTYQVFSLFLCVLVDVFVQNVYVGLPLISFLTSVKAQMVLCQ